MQQLSTLLFVFFFSLVSSQADLPNIVVRDTDFQNGVDVQFALETAPTGTVLVALDSPELLRVDKCHLQFTKDDWQTPKTVTLYPHSNGILSQAVQMQLYVKVYRTHDSDMGQNSTCTVANMTVPITREVLASKICTSIGDPHLSTFDGVDYEAPHIGYFNMVQSDGNETVIQVEHFRCAGDFTCNNKVAIKHFDAFLSISNPVPYHPTNPAIVELVRGAKDRITYVQTGNSYAIQLSDGTHLTVNFYQFPDHSFNRLDVQISAPGTYRNRVSGLCGNFNDDAADDMKNLPCLYQITPNSDWDLFSCKSTCTGYAVQDRDVRECLIPTGFKPAICDVPFIPTPTPTTTPPANFTSTSTPTPTPTINLTSTPTANFTSTPTYTFTPTLTTTPSANFTSTPTPPVSTPTYTFTPTPLPPANLTSTPTPPVSTSTPTPTTALIQTPPANLTSTPAYTSTPNPTPSPKLTPTPTPDVRPSSTPACTSITDSTPPPKLTPIPTPSPTTSIPKTSSAVVSTCSPATTPIPSATLKTTRTSTPAPTTTNVDDEHKTVVCNPITIEKYDGVENRVAYCMRIAAQYQGKETAALVSSFCNTDVKLTTGDPTDLVASLVKMLQTRAQAKARLTLSPAGVDPDADVQKMMDKFQLSTEATKYVNPDYGSAGSSPSPTPSVASVLKCRIRNKPSY